MSLSIPVLLGAMGAAILAYRSVWILRDDLGLSVEDMAWRCAVYDMPGLSGFTHGPVYGLDCSKLQALLRKRVDAHLWLALTIISTGMTLAVLIMPRSGYDPIDAAARSSAFGIAGALLLLLISFVGYRYAWRWLRERWWFAQVWLTWLEHEVADPLAATVNPSLDFVLIAHNVPHPNLRRFLDERWAGQHGHLFTIEDRQAIEHWIADFAKKWKHRFGPAWQRWQSQTLLSLATAAV